VLDASGAVIPNAAVQVIDAATGQPVRSLTTSSSGNFRATLLPLTFRVVVSVTFDIALPP
jgi:hypothetical protein